MFSAFILYSFLNLILPLLLLILVRSSYSSPPCNSCYFTQMRYRKIPKISPWAYIFQRPFLRGLFLEGLIFGRAYLRREIWVSKSIGLALYLEVNLPFLFCFTLYLRAIFQAQAPRGLIFGGAI